MLCRLFPVGSEVEKSEMLPVYPSALSQQQNQHRFPNFFLTDVGMAISTSAVNSISGRDSGSGFSTCD